MSLRYFIACLIGAFALLAGGTYFLVDSISENTSRRMADERLSLLSDTLLTTIERYTALPSIAGKSRAVAAVLLKKNEETRDNANIFLETTALEAGVAALFILDDQGQTLAASNWREPGSFVGHDYSFRPYFVEALQTSRGQYYGVGVTTGQPGYFLSSLITLSEGVTGVAVVKVDFSALRSSWASGGEHVFVSDADGVVFLSTDTALMYRPLLALDPGRTATIHQEQRYANNNIGMPIQQDEWPSGAHATRTIAGTQWQMTVVTPWVAKGWVPAGAAMLVVLAQLVIVLAYSTHRQRGARLAAERAAFVEMEKRVSERTQDLASALGQLEVEIAERQRIDGELHHARDELVQAAKLSAMGLALSGLAHELNQPLAALRTFLASTRAFVERDDKVRAFANFEVMEGEVMRLGALTSDLRNLSRRSEPYTEVVDLGSVGRRVASLLKFRIADAGAALAVTSTGSCCVNGNANRLEQVVLNLVLNALDAVANLPDPVIEMRIHELEGKVILVVSDPGPGISPELNGRLFEPFCTSKSNGVGLGLAISYAIVRDHLGTLHYARTAAGKTEMILSLPVASAKILEPADPGRRA